jgi:hypothetical protein
LTVTLMGPGVAVGSVGVSVGSGAAVISKAELRQAVSTNNRTIFINRGGIRDFILAKARK